VPQTGPGRSWHGGNARRQQGKNANKRIFDYDNADFFSNLFLFTFVLLMLTVVAAFARDAGMKG
jgi:hypothetical protein